MNINETDDNIRLIHCKAPDDHVNNKRGFDRRTVLCGATRHSDGRAVGSQCPWRIRAIGWGV